jgi:hypothetical protein
VKEDYNTRDVEIWLSACVTTSLQERNGQLDDDDGDTPLGRCFKPQIFRKSLAATIRCQAWP